MVLGLAVACALAPAAALGIPPLPGSISGMRTLPGGELDALNSPRTYQWTSGYWTQISPSTTSFFDGTYLVSGVPAGVYRVGVPEVAVGAVAYPPAFWGGGRSPAEGADITVLSGTDSPGKDTQRDTSETIAGDALEPDNSARQATSVTPGSHWVERTCFGLPDSDWVKFDAVAGHTYTIETSGSATYPIWGNLNYVLSDTFLSLFASDGKTLIAENDDGNLRNSRVRWTATSSGPMYARVVSNGEAQGGSPTYAAYTLRLSDDSAIAGTASLQGSVRDSGTGHAPIAGAWLELYNMSNPAGDWRYPITRADGTFSVTGLTPGNYSVKCDAVGYATTMTVDLVPVAAGQSVHLDLDMLLAAPSAGEIRGSVMHAAGGAAAGALAVLDGGGPAKESVIDATGYFGFEDVEIGYHTVTVTEPNYTSVTRQNVRVGSGNGDLYGPVLIETLFPAGTITGVVRSAGVGLAGVTVSASDATTTTAADGSYVLSGVAAGAADITFGKPTYVSAVLNVGVSQGATSTLDATLVHPKTACTITRSPKQSTLTYKRRKGSAKFTLGASLSGVYGRFGSSPVYLQYSSNGKTGWKSFPKQTTNANGVASKAIVVKKKSTKYYRWYTPSTSAHAASYSVKQKVVVK